VGDFADGTWLDGVGEVAGLDAGGRADVGEGLARRVVRDGAGVGLRLVLGLGFGLVVDTDVPSCAGVPAGTGGGRTTR
jgi:hypothetical protein